jgi:hypothetical protein
MLTIKAVRKPRWSDAAHTALNLFVTFEETADTHGEMPFTALANDTEDHGRDLFERAVAGEFGAIPAYVAPVPTETQLYAQWKAQREAAVAAITVQAASGRVYDGDEISQGRMARAIVGLMDQPPGATVRWVLADNSAALVTMDELKEALTLAGLRQTELWVKP